MSHRIHITNKLIAYGLLLALAACASSPPSHFYTLMGSAASVASNTAPVSAATDTAVNANHPFFIEVPPVAIPPQLQRPQLVLDTGPGQVDILEQRRWSQPLGDEIAQALSQNLTRRLPALDVYHTAHPANRAVYRIDVNVQRFESQLNRQATLAAVWSVTRLPQGVTMTCRSTISVPAGAGYPALIASHRQAIARMGQRIASAIRRLARQVGGKTAALSGCPIR